MNIEFQITRDEYVSAGLLNGEVRGRVRILHRLIDAVLIVAALVLLHFGAYVISAGLIGAAIGANLIPYLFRFLFVPWYLKRHYRKYPLIHKPLSISVVDEGIKFKSSGGEGLVLWHEIHKWREGKDMVLVYPAPRIYYLIPKRAAELTPLLEALSTNVGKAT